MALSYLPSGSLRGRYDALCIAAKGNAGNRSHSVRSGRRRKVPPHRLAPDIDDQFFVQTLCADSAEAGGAGSGVDLDTSKTVALPLGTVYDFRGRGDDKTSIAGAPPESARKR
jgi:hypothetical protein